MAAYCHMWNYQTFRIVRNGEHGTRHATFVQKNTYRTYGCQVAIITSNANIAYAIYLCGLDAPEHIGPRVSVRGYMRIVRFRLRMARCTPV